MAVIELEGGVELEVPDGLSEQQMGEIVDHYYSTAATAAPEVASASGVFPGGDGGHSAAALLGLAGLAGGIPGGVAQGQAPGAETATGGVEGPGALDYLGALPGIAQILDVKDVITQGFEPSDQFPYFALPESIGERRELGNDITNVGTMVVGSPVAGKAAAAGGRVAKQFAPDLTGALLGGSIGGAFLPGLGTLAGAKLGARQAANILGRGKGLRSRTRTAIRGNKRGSEPTTIETRPVDRTTLSQKERAADLQRLLLD